MSTSKQLSPCWECQGVAGKDGYVSIWVGNNQVRAHRVAYSLFCGKIHHTKSVLHACDNKRCINPSHLFLGTQRDNVHDCMKKGRFTIGSRNGVSKLTEAQVSEMRSLYGKYGHGGMIQRELAKKYGVSRVLVSDITRGKTWKHVTS